jgi:ATP/maltotriose-dependent transcriptional regulator MalT
MVYIEPLTKREREVLALAAQGFTNGEIAGTLYISAATVRRHLNSIYSKLGISAGTCARLVAALKAGMLVYSGPPIQGARLNRAKEPSFMMS